MSSKQVNCAYGQVTRQMVEDLKCSINKNFQQINSQLADIKEENKQLYNHLSSRLPIWVTIMFTICGSLIVGLIVASVR